MSSSGSVYDEDEFGIIDRRYAGKDAARSGSATLLWHVDDIEATFARAQGHGHHGVRSDRRARERLRHRLGRRSVRRRFGIMSDPHYVEMLDSRTA